MEYMHPQHTHTHSTSSAHTYTHPTREKRERRNILNMHTINRQKHKHSHMKQTTYTHAPWSQKRHGGVPESTEEQPPERWAELSQRTDKTVETVCERGGYWCIHYVLFLEFVTFFEFAGFVGL
jgi:hypothetical protein